MNDIAKRLRAFARCRALALQLDELIGAGLVDSERATALRQQMCQLWLELEQPPPPSNYQPTAYEEAAL